MTELDIIVRAIVGWQLLLLAALAVAVRRDHTGFTGAACCLAVIAFVFTSTPDSAWLGLWVYPLTALCVTKAALFWLFARGLFADTFRLRRADGAYRSGRSPEWRKVRAHRTDDFVVIGLKASKNARDSYGSLHIAQYVGDELAYAGSVGTGLTPKHMKEVIARAGEATRVRPAVDEDLPGSQRARDLAARLQAGA